jgi:hypothetical protein
MKLQHRPIYFSNNAMTLSDKMQLIIRFYGEPDKIHENYYSKLFNQGG